MIDYWKSCIPSIPTTGLIDLAKDAEQRIGSHVDGGNQIDAYVQKQQVLLEIIQDELERR